MTRDMYRYQFQNEVPMAGVEDTLVLATCAAEGVHGRAQVRLDGAFRLDHTARTCIVDAASVVGQTLSRIFTELLTREYGGQAFNVRRVVENVTQEPKQGRRVGR